MNKLKGLFLLICTFFLISAAAAEQIPRIAILPFNPIGVSESDAKVLTNLFEAAIVKTGVFEVIEQNQADRILDAQAYTLSSCTDETCAVEIGELLSAESIIIGSVSKLGEMFIVTAKIIDVTTGKNIRADSVQGGKIEEMTEQVGILAGKLADPAGHNGARATGASAAEGTGEIFVHTNPADAQLSINGTVRGKSPLLIKSLPAGKLLLEARSGPLYASREVTISLDELLEITLTLEAASGRLFIQTDDPSLKVIIDGKNAGTAASGLFKDIIPGEHELVVENNERYYKGSFSVDPGKTAELEIYPLWLGEIKWELPEAATATFSGEMITAEFSGMGEERLPSGSYEVKITGPYYIDFETEIRISKDNPALFTPDLSFSNSPEARTYLTKKRIESLETEREDLQRRVNELQPRSWVRTTGWILAGCGAAELLIAGTSAIVGLVASSTYNNSTDALEISASRNTAEFCSDMINYTLWPGLILGAAAPFMITIEVNEDPEPVAERLRLADRIEALDTEISALKEEIK
jgi:TolB-like protein